jgi:AraC family transcriptional regulator
MFADVITFNAHRRLLAIDALQRLGAKVEGCGSPIEYVAHLAGA